ncbi:hypothetical protein QQ045_031057 [Rhodiola kirilowii]
MEKKEHGSLEKQIEDITDTFKGKVAVSLEEEDWRKMNEEFKWAQVLKLANGRSFNLTGLTKVLTKIWNVEDKAKFAELANNMALVKFDYECDLIRIKDGGPPFLEEGQARSKRPRFNEAGAAFNEMVAFRQGARSRWSRYKQATSSN